MNGNPSNPIVYGWAGVILAQSPLQNLTKLSHRTKFGHPSGDDGSTPILGTLGGSPHTIAVGKIRSAFTNLCKKARQEAIDLMLLRQANGGKCATTRTK